MKEHHCLFTPLLTNNNSFLKAFFSFEDVLIQLVNCCAASR